MKWLSILFVAIVLLASCKSTKRVSTQVHKSTDSTSYQQIVKVTIDTTTIEADSASLEVLIGKSTSGSTVPFIIEQVTQEQGDDVKIDFQVIKTPSGGAMVKVKAITKPKEVYSTNKETEIIRKDVSATEAVSVSEKKVTRLFNPLHLIWLIPVAVVAFLVYKKWPIIKAFFGL